MGIDLPDLYANTGSFGFSFKLIILFFFFQKSIQILFADRALLTISSYATAKNCSLTE